MELELLIKELRKLITDPHIKKILHAQVYRHLNRFISQNLKLADSISKRKPDFYDTYNDNPKLIWLKKPWLMAFLQDIKFRNYDGWAQECIELDLYRKVLAYLGIVRMMKFCEELDQVGAKTIDDLALSTVIIRQMEHVRDLVNMKTDDIKAKNPSRQDIDLLIHGVQRLITVDLKDTDWLV